MRNLQEAKTMCMERFSSECFCQTLLAGKVKEFWRKRRQDVFVTNFHISLLLAFPPKLINLRISTVLFQFVMAIYQLFLFPQNKIVRSAQLQDLDGNQTSLPSETETSLLSFIEFNAASMKNQQLTVREMFAKHLLQLYGISADKARAVVDKVLFSFMLMC